MLLKKVINNILLENEIDLYEYSDVIINEAGANINRVLDHLNNDNTCMITAYRSTNSNIKNELNNKKLANDIRNLGYSYIRVIGVYKEENSPKASEENSFLVIDKDMSEKNQNIFFKRMLKLCSIYNQDSVLISLPNNKNIPIASYNGDGKIVYGPYNKINIDIMNEFFTKVHGHTYSYTKIAESKGIKPDSYQHAMAYYDTQNKFN